MPQHTPETIHTPDSGKSESTRRDFMKASAATVLGTGWALQSDVLRAAHSSVDETIRVGLVGCGGRGTGAAVQTLQADPGTRLVAMADAFGDRLELSLKSMQKRSNVADRVQVDPDRQFVGFDAFRKVIDSGVDVVILATPPHFRPQHLRACIDANKHVFAEKPVAVDAPGIRSVLKTTEAARKKDLMLVSGLCWRYEPGMSQTIEKVRNGAVGDLVALHSTRYNQGVGKLAKRKPEWTDMEYQMRNWYYFTWLSGDFNVEQFVHEMDKMSWIMGDQPPARCTSTGGRINRTADHYGHVYDHFSSVFEYDDGVKYFAATRQQQGADSLFFDHVMGTDGMADLMKFTITGKNSWRWGKRRQNMHQLEQDAMYAALRKGETINNGDYMAKSTMLGIMARMSAYTGKSLTWEEALNSKHELAPEAYTWEAAPPPAEVAIPGVTPFV